MAHSVHNVLLRRRMWIPGIGKSADDRRYNVRETELGDGRDMLDDVITEGHSFRDEGARVAGDDWDGLGRVDVVAGDVDAVVGRPRVDNVRLAKVNSLYQLVVVAAHLVHLQARVLLCPNDLNGRKKFVVRTTRQQQLYSQCQGLCDQLRSIKYLYSQNSRMSNLRRWRVSD